MEDKIKCLWKNQIIRLDVRLKDPRLTWWFSRLWFSWRWGIYLWRMLGRDILFHHCYAEFPDRRRASGESSRRHLEIKVHSADPRVLWVHMNQRKVEKSSVMDCCYQDGAHMWASGQGEGSWALRDGPFKSTVQTQCLWYIHLKLLNFIFNYVCTCHYVGCKCSTGVSGKQRWQTPLDLEF